MMMLSWDERGTLVPFSSIEELEQLLDERGNELTQDEPPVMVTVLDGDDPAAPALSIGCGTASSVAVWRTPEETVSLLSYGDREGGESMEFSFCGEPVKYPPSAIIASEAARDAVRRFVASGTRPEGVRWQRP